jgi:hypothetical protein
MDIPPLAVDITVAFGVEHRSRVLSERMVSLAVLGQQDSRCTSLMETSDPRRRLLLLVGPAFYQVGVGGRSGYPYCFWKPPKLSRAINPSSLLYP